LAYPKIKNAEIKVSVAPPAASNGYVRAPALNSIKKTKPDMSSNSNRNIHI